MPFIVTLREYGAMKKERPCSISDHIAETIHTRLGLPGCTEPICSWPDECSSFLTG